MITYFCNVIYFRKTIIESRIEKQWMPVLKFRNILKQIFYVPPKLYYTALPGLSIKHAKMSSIHLIHNRFSDTLVHHMNDKITRILNQVMQAINSYSSEKSQKHKPFGSLNDGNNKLN